VFSIGEFSKITGLTVKTLRFYHEQQLLPPASIDDRSGYRYYSDG
jgi:DNA-binding transcriptional MerR regulator